MYFLRRHGIFQEIQGFVEFLCGNIWHFEPKKAKKFFLDWKHWNLQGFSAPYGTWDFFFDFYIGKIMVASKRFPSQCKQNMWMHGSKILHKLSAKIAGNPGSKFKFLP